MPIYAAPSKDIQYVLQDVLNLSAQDIPGYGDLEADFTAAVLEEAGKLASEVLAPLNVVGDTQGCTLENGVVRTPKGFAEAYQLMRAWWLDGSGLRPRIWRPGHALRDGNGGWRNVCLREYGVQHLPGPDPRCLFGHSCPRCESRRQNTHGIGRMI